MCLSKLKHFTYSFNCFLSFQIKTWVVKSYVKRTRQIPLRVIQYSYFDFFLTWAFSMWAIAEEQLEHVKWGTKY